MSATELSFSKRQTMFRSGRRGGLRPTTRLFSSNKSDRAGRGGTEAMDQSPFSIRGEPQAAPAGLDRVSLGPAGGATADSADPSPLRIDDDDRYGRLRLISWWR